MIHSLRNNAIARRLGAIAWCLLLLTPSGVAFAEGETWTMPTTIASAEDGAPVDPAEVLDVVDGKVALGLDHLVTLALQRNLSLVVERYRRSQSELRIREALGIYDFTLDVQGSTGQDSEPSGSTLDEADILDTETQVLNSTFSRLLPIGGTAEVIFNNLRFTSSNLIVQPNPRSVVNLDFRYSQPLLRNFGKLVTERNILVARTNAEISREDFQVQVEGVIEQASTAYWDLVEALEQLSVALESLELAENLHEMNRIQVEVGTLAPLEMVQSEAGVASRRQDIIRLRAQVQDQEDTLRRLINLDRGDLWNTEIDPTTDPELAHQTIDVDAAFEAAVAARPDIRRLRLDLENRELDAKVARSQTKPRLDAQATWGTNALVGDIRDNRAPGRPFLDRNDHIDAIDSALTADFTGWTIGFQFTMPIQNREAKAAYEIARLDVERGEFELRDLEEEILTEVRRTARAVETAAQQIESAKVSSKLARKNLEAEQKRYENGLSTSFQVLQIQEDLSEARRQEVSAIISYRRAEVSYQRTVGQLLAVNGVQLAEDE